MPFEDQSGILALPQSFTFNRKGFVDFDRMLRHFDWTLHDRPVVIDLTTCDSANFQAIALLIQYAWRLTMNGCAVTFKYGIAATGPTKMLNKMGAVRWREILVEDGRDFDTRSTSGKTFALRRRSDAQNVINHARNAINSYSIKFPDYLSYIISEMLYNATEHGRRQAEIEGSQVLVPSVFQFGYYPGFNRFSFIFADLGMGIKAHLEQAYPTFSTHQEAIIHALRPRVSGTFRQQTEPYAAKNNAGLGLTYSSQMSKQLKGDMYIVSFDGVVHVSPEDVTSRKLLHTWPGTFVLINLNISQTQHVSVDALMAEITARAESEVSAFSDLEQEHTLYVNIYNYFGKYAEDKDAAIAYRDRHLIPAIRQGKRIELDFQEVETAPHSFLNALLATPVTILGPKAYQWIKVRNAPGAIHEIIGGVLEDNLPKLQ
ncbi:MAG: STAS-like domain-containing protein [Bryobacteraceae bacterium]